jgi:uncharacterized membrane protein YedE/YeeE
MISSPGAIWSSLAGGALIGAAAATLLLANGRIAGVSGIVDRVLYGTVGEHGWRLAFLVGLVVPALLTSPSHVVLSASPEILAISGLLVGYGTRTAGGCTSGHGVCGLANRSVRSLAATLVFTCVAIATVAARHVVVSP